MHHLSDQASLRCDSPSHPSQFLRPSQLAWIHMCTHEKPLLRSFLFAVCNGSASKYFLALWGNSWNSRNNQSQWSQMMNLSSDLVQSSFTPGWLSCIVKHRQNFYCCPLQVVIQFYLVWGPMPCYLKVCECPSVRLTPNWPDPCAIWAEHEPASRKLKQVLTKWVAH
jgi:hypothetical protein